jgi:hypothetical protein
MLLGEKAIGASGRPPSPGSASAKSRSRPVNRASSISHRSR